MYSEPTHTSVLREVDAARQRVQAMSTEERRACVPAAYDALRAIREHLELLAFNEEYPEPGAMMLLERLACGDLIAHPNADDFERIRFPGAAKPTAQELRAWRAVGHDLAETNYAIHLLVLSDGETRHLPRWAWRSLSHTIRGIYTYLRSVESSLASRPWPRRRSGMAIPDSARRKVGAGEPRQHRSTQQNQPASGPHTNNCRENAK